MHCFSSGAGRFTGRCALVLRVLLTLLTLAVLAAPLMAQEQAGGEANLKLPDLDLSFWYAMFGPKGIPDAVKAKLSKAVETVMSDPKVRERLAKLDIEPQYAPADVLGRKLQTEITNWTKFIDAKGIKAE